jgi:hypothetical protein
MESVGTKLPAVRSIAWLGRCAPSEENLVHHGPRSLNSGAIYHPSPVPAARDESGRLAASNMRISTRYRDFIEAVCGNHIYITFNADGWRQSLNRIMSAGPR